MAFLFNEFNTDLQTLYAGRDWLSLKNDSSTNVCLLCMFLQAFSSETYLINCAQEETSNQTF